MKQKIYTLMLLTLVLMLSACGGDNPAEKAIDKATSNVDKNSPNGAFMAVVDSFKKNDVKGLMQATMSTEDFQQAMQEFETKKREPTESEKVQFAQTMEMLTTDGAVDKMMAMVSPQLEQARAQLPMLLMMGKGMVGPSIQSSPDIPAEQKESLTKIANAFIDYASNTDLLSEEITRKAISSAVNTAKSLNMKSLDEVQNMSFDQAMGKASIVMGGFKDVLAVYGISMDDILSSVKLSDVVENGDAASMNLAYQLFGETFNQAIKMKKVNGQWVAAQ